MQFKVSANRQRWDIVGDNIETCHGNMPSSELPYPTFGAIKVMIEGQGTGTEAAIRFLAEMRKRGFEKFTSTSQTPDGLRLFNSLMEKGYISCESEQELLFRIGVLPSE
jgi:hypothetical protein